MTDPLERMLAMRVQETRYCVYCGRPYVCSVLSRRLVCSARCNTKRWRAIGMLAGTHANVNGRFVRVYTA